MTWTMAKRQEHYLIITVYSRRLRRRLDHCGVNLWPQMTIVAAACIADEGREHLSNRHAFAEESRPALVRTAVAITAARLIRTKSSI